MSPRSGNGTPSGGTGDDRIAIVGVGCRFPGGVRTLDAFGRLLSAGGHVFTEVPPERWGPERSAAGGGPISNGVGAFLDDIDRFDAAYFGVTPREANLLDPQQRLILEVAWEAMSDSGRPREAWRGSRTAVMFGLLAKDYELLHARTLGVGEISQHHISGMEFSFSAGRLAYTFDLRGPVSAVNSACSSSLLAVHQACQSLRADDCDTAVAGGVSLLITPDVSVFLSKVGAISPSGRCTPFDAAADGIVRGEGAGAVVLKRLADAVADRDRIYAVIRGSAANNDGTSLGLTVPNAAAQAELLARALHRSGLAATDVDYVEAHGTGTAIGDMMELEAIGEVYGAGRDRANPVLVGSHKALLGHMDAAAGIGGLLKSTWVVNSGLIPQQPYVQQLNPAADWRDGALAVPLAAVDLAGRGRAARAGVSSFGLSGTNVHVIVEAPTALGDPAAAPDPAGGPAAAGRPLVLLSSAAGAAGLSEQVAGVRELVDASAHDALADLSAATATRRTHEAHRFAVVAADREQALACLEEVDEPQDGAYAGVVPDPDSVPAPVFVFSGQGGQWPGMAMDLYDSDPVVREALEECEELIRAEASWSLLDRIRDTEGDGGLERTEIVQPALFAVQVALTRWLAARGVTPGAIVGHSLGEVAAAHAAGVLALPDAVRLIVRRSELLGEASGAGLMFAVQGEEPAVDAVLAETGLPVTVVAVNSPGGLIVAGPTDAVTEAAAALQDHGMRCRQLRVDAPAHSPVIAHLGPRLEAALAGLEPARPAVRMVSTVDPDAAGTVFDAAYWARNFTSPVRLWPAVDRLLAEDDHPLVEIGPHPVLVPSLAEAQRLRGRTAPALPVLNRYEAGPLAAHKALARLHVAGVPVDWERVTGRPRRYRTLPVPSWEGGRFWLPGVRRGQQGATDPRTPAAGSAAPPARIRISLLDADGTVTGEMYAEPAGSPGATPAGASLAAAASPASSGAPNAPSAVRASADTAPVPAPAPAVRQTSGSRPGGAGRVAAMAELVTTTVRHLLGLPESQPVARRRGLFEQGLDSLTAVALRTTLGEALGVTLPAPIVFERPTVAALAAYLAEVAPAEAVGTAEAGGGPTAAPEAPTAVPEGAPSDDGIAVIGVSCRLPGAPGTDAFWDLLTNRTSTAADYPADRAMDPVWREMDAGLPVKGSYLDDIAAFDAPFFRISPREAKLLDPQQRLFLEVAWQALEDAGCPAHTLADQPVGVYAGLSMADYQHLVVRDMDSASLNLYHGTGTSFAALAGRLSYVLGLRGPSMTVDTACSASLTAVHLACQALRTGDCEIAVVGGASAIVSPSPLIASMAASGALSRDGRCKTFDEDADGFGCGEGAVVMVLKPVAAALRDGDRVYAVLRGSAVNQDGATGGLTVPNGTAQADVVRKAVSRAGWAPHEVDYVEAHGTGTPLGDPIEVRALVESLGSGRGPDAPLLLGSAKANVGHLGAAAGAVGLLKVVLALRNGVLPPHLVERPSTRIEWDSLPVALVTDARPWPAHGRPARAGVSAFGFSGSNAHVVVEQFVPADGLRADTGAPDALGATAASAAPAAQDQAHLLLASAAGPEALREVLRRLADELRAAPERAADIVFTATCRRSLLEHRLAVPAASTAELVAALDAAAAGEPAPDAVAGRVEDGEERVIGFRYGAEPPSAATLARWSGFGSAYADTLAECARLLAELTGGPCDLAGEPAEPLRAAHLFAHQAAATALWRRLGVAPRAVTGTGAGRVTAAWADGRLTLAEALRALTADGLSAIDGGIGAGGGVGVEVGAGFGVDEDAVAGCDLVVDVLPETGSPLALAAELFATGCRPVAPGDGGRRHVTLPAYPWEHESYWYRDFSAAPTVPWVLSAADRAGLLARTERLREFAATGPDVAGTAHALASRAGDGAAERLVVVGGGVDELVDGLGGFAGSGSGSGSGSDGGSGLGLGVVSGVVGGSVSAPVLVFPGQGWQWAGMGVELLGSSAVFARAVAEVSAVVEELAGWSVLDVLRDAGRAAADGQDSASDAAAGGGGVVGLGRVDRVQPVMFAVMVGLARVWESAGVVPGAVVGHSQGEIAAACVAGVLSLKDAVRVVVARSAALVELAGTGCMVSVTASREQAEDLIGTRWPGRLWIAAVNGPSSVVIAGHPQAGTELLNTQDQHGLRARRIEVDYASHCPLVEPVADTIRHTLAGITPTPGHTPLYSTLTGTLIEGTAMNADYWYDNLRNPVRFAPTLTRLLHDGHTVYIEASAHPVLTTAITDTAEHTTPHHPEHHTPTTVTGTLRRNDGGTRRLLTSAATLWTTGTPITWTTLLPPPPNQPTHLPATLWDDSASGPAAGASSTETRFWRTVERADGAELAGLLGVRNDDERASLDAFLPLLSQWWQTRRETEAVNAWRYRVTWQPVAHAPQGALTGSWLVAVPEGMADHETVTACAKAISEHGGNPVVLPLDTAGPAAPADAFTADDGQPVAGVLSLLGLDESAHPEHLVVPAGLLATVRLYQAMEQAGCDARVWSVTSGAVAVAGEEAPAHPAQAHLWGLNRAAGLENPQRLAGVIDLPAELDPRTAALLAAALAGAGDEDQLAVRGGALHARRLAPAPVAEAPGEPWTPSGTVLITGGTGALGSHVARWFSRRHADLVLTSRRGTAAPGAAELREELLGLGAGSVTVAACDAADRDALAALLADIPADRPLDAVIHTAGVVDDGPVNELSAGSLADVLLPKTGAVRNLHDLTADRELSAFVLFSSAGALLPNVGQAAYAAGNAYLDAFAAHRRAAGLPALSVAWGAWAGAGMAEEEGFVDWIGRGGMDLMTPHLAVVALQQALDHADTNVVIADVDWERFAQRHNAARPNPLVAALVAPAAAATQAGAEADGLARLAGLPADRRGDALLDSVIAELAAVLGHSSTRGVRSDAAFKDLGIDSVTAIELRNRVTAVTGLRFSPVAVFDHPTSELLSEHLLTLLPADGDGSVGDTGDADSGTGSASSTGSAVGPDQPTAGGSRIDSMAIEDLVRMARGTNGS